MSGEGVARGWVIGDRPCGAVSGGRSTLPIAAIRRIERRQVHLGYRVEREPREMALRVDAAPPSVR